VILTSRTKESFKTALAMTIAYGIALSMDWDRPYWAGFAVAFVSLATIGQSLNKAALRMLGTLLAVAVSLSLIALFAQQRWAFIVCLSAIVGFCCYMMSGSKRAYFWQVAGFVVVIICLDAGPDPINAFNTAILRAQETGLGILVYSLVAIFLWPSSSRANFDAATARLALTQQQLYRASLAMMKGKDNVEEVQSLKAQTIQQQSQSSQLLDAALGDSYEVRELRRPWQLYQRQMAELAETMELWREGFAEVQALDLQRLLPNLDAFCDELDSRLAQIAKMLDGDTLEQAPQAMTLSIDKDALRNLSHFKRAALVVSRQRMLHLEQLSRSLFEVVIELKGPGTASASAKAPRVAAAAFIPDLDRLANVVRYIMILWLAWLALIYVNDIPGGAGLVSFAGALGIAIANMPQLPVSKLFVPAASSVLFAAVVYIFVMPQLSSFMGLGPLIFIATFAICYLYADPRQMLGRALGLAMFVVIASITNEQTYNFLSVANTAMMFPLIFLILAITAYIPVSPRPERAFLRLLGRYFRSSEYLISSMRSNPAYAATRLGRWKNAFYEREVATLPAKLGSWAPHLDNWALSGTSAAQVQTLVTSLQSLTNRLQLLFRERNTPQAPLLVQNLLADFQAWHTGVQETFQNLSGNPASGEQQALRTRVTGIVNHMEQRIAETLNNTAAGQLSERDEENFYRLLGAYRGVSEALVDYATSSSDIDWAQWREERFA
jgi:uncharacterized membrane protein YccC